MQNAHRMIIQRKLHILEYPQSLVHISEFAKKKIIKIRTKHNGNQLNKLLYIRVLMA